MCQRLQILVEEKGGVVKEVGERITKASRAFGILKKKNSNLSYETNRHYKAVVLEILLYGSETWTTKRFNVRKVEAFPQ